MAETLNKAIKAIKAYAKTNGRNYIQVRQEFEHTYGDMDNGKTTLSAYIDGFGIWPKADTIAGLVEQFDAVKSGVKPNPTPIAIDDDLPF